MKKVLFYTLLLVMSVSFASCEGTDSLRDKIVANQSYEGTDDDGEKWLGMFSVATVNLTATKSALNLSCTDWDVVENADGTGTITLKGVVSDGYDPFDMSGTVDKNAKKIVLQSADLVITLEKK